MEIRKIGNTKSYNFRLDSDIHDKLFGNIKSGKSKLLMKIIKEYLKKEN